MLQVGDTIPQEIQLHDENGKQVTLKQFLNNPLVVYFYPKDETPGCTKEACSFRDNYDDIQNEGYTVVGISKDSPESHAKFKERHALNFPLLTDESGELLEAFGVWKEKNMFGKKFKGIQRSTFLVDAQGTIQHVWPKVKPTDHGAQVLNWIRGN